MTEHYRKYEKLIHKAAWSRVAKNSNLELDELKAWGNLAYCEALQTWDPARGAFSTHLTWKIRHRLSLANQRKIDDDNHTTDLDEAHNVTNSGDPLGNCSFSSALAGLSAEAQEVVNLILGSSGELVDFTAKCVKVTRGNIINYLRSRRWPGNTIRAAMAEIKDMLKGGT